MKSCLFCKHFNWSRIEQLPRWSDATPGEWVGGFECLVGHWLRAESQTPALVDGDSDNPPDLASLRALMAIAETCPDYTPATDGSMPA